MKAHIFLDNSNIFGGAQRVAREKEQAPWPSVRVDYRNLFAVLAHGKKNRGISMLAGSVPPGNDALWDAATNAGFDTTLLKRVGSDNGRLVEQGVDEAIHLKISNLLIDSFLAKTKGMLVLATGDGAQTEQDCSFTDQALRAIQLGWHVEVWSWQSQLSKRLRDLRVKYPDNMKIMKLDEWYRGIVFIKAGEYELNGQRAPLSGRSCQPLYLTETTFKDAAVA